MNCQPEGATLRMSVSDPTLGPMAPSNSGDMVIGAPTFLSGYCRRMPSSAAAGVNRLPWEDRVVPRGKCVPGPSRLCLNDRRFAVDVEFAALNGRSGDALTYTLTDDTGAFTFFDRSNLEMLIKVLNACPSQFHTFWVFAAGLTNVEVDITVTDTKTGATKSYHNPQSSSFSPIQDTSAFATCP